MNAQRIFDTFEDIALAEELHPCFITFINDNSQYEEAFDSEEYSICYPLEEAFADVLATVKTWY